MEIIKYKDVNEYVAKNGNCKYKRVFRREQATKFEDGKAEKFIRNCVQKLFRNRMEVINIGKETDKTHVVNTSSTKTDADTHDAQKHSAPSVPFTPSTPATLFDNLDFDWYTKLKQEEEFVKDLEKYKQKLPLMLSKVDTEISDVEHYIEFNRFSACEGYKLCKLLKEKRETRRKIKNEMQISEMLYQKWSDKHNVNDIYRLIDKIAARYYNPKVLNEIFD